jgi:hypothetical protein
MLATLFAGQHCKQEVRIYRPDAAGAFCRLEPIEIRFTALLAKFGER